MPTVQELQARLNDLKNQAELFRQQYNMTLGAIAECEFWLSQTESADSTVKDAS